MIAKRRSIPFSAPVIFASLYLCAGRAEAHLVTTGLGPLYDGIGHLLLSPDDLLPAIALALLAGLRGPAAGRWALFALPAAWFLGGLAGMSVARPPSFPFSALTFMLIGVLVASNPPLSARGVGAIAILLGLIHGAIDGTAMQAAGFGGGALELFGIAASLFVFTALFAALVVSLRVEWMRIVVRVAGSWIGAMGLLYLGWMLRGTK